MPNSLTSWSVLASAILLGGRSADSPVEKVQLTLATLHAATLTSSRVAGDTTDSPFFVLEVIGPNASSASILTNGAQDVIRNNGAVAARPLAELSLGAGDSVQVRVSVLEHPALRASDGTRVASMKNTVRATSEAQHVEHATRLVSPLVKDGALWVGSVSLLVTNEGGTLYWRRLDCVATCRVLNGPAGAAVPAGQAPPLAGITELTGSGGTYHLALRANRMP